MNCCLLFLIEFQILFSKVNLKFAECDIFALPKRKRHFPVDYFPPIAFFLNKGKSQKPLKSSEEQ